MSLLPPANEVCKGYVFTGVCLSTGGLSLCPGGSQSLGVSVQGVSVQGDLCPGESVQGGLSRGVSVMGALCPGGLSHGGSLSRGISVQGGLSRGSLSKGVSVTETPHMVMSVWYTSYWNAFLFV